MILHRIEERGSSDAHGRTTSIAVPDPGSDESAYAQNRRDEFEVTAGGDNLVAPQ